MSSCCSHSVNDVFGERTAAHDLRRYRRKGPAKPTRVLLDALRAEGVGGASVLDIGGGIGAIGQELLAGGAGHVTGVEASAAYLRAAREEAERRGTTDRVSYREGDFVVLADEIPAADVVTLDRVICCYPDMDVLVGRSADRAAGLYGLVFPRDTWWVRLGFRIVNLGFRISRRRFRVHVHRTAAVDATARGRGLSPRAHRRAGPVWQVSLYARVT